jgi:hypothetical protein
MVGDPNTEEGQKLIREASPLFSVEKINRPLLIIQGANDPRVKQAESDQIVIALRDKGKKVDYLLAKDEGHGFAKPLNKKAMYAYTEKFLAEILGGRYQTDMAEDVQNALNNLIVDVSTVTYQPKESLKMSASLPAINNQWKEGKSEYDVSIEVSGQKIPMTLTRTIEKKDGLWTITDESQSPMGSMKDEMVYKDFQPVSRKINQMGQEIPMTFSEQKMSLNMMGQTMDISFEGAYLADGPGTDIIIGGFDLKEGFSLTFSVPDMMSAKAKTMVLNVTGNETINGINYWVVEVTNHENESDKTTYYIHPDNKSADKMVQVLPAMQNAVMTMIKK